MEGSTNTSELLTSYSQTDISTALQGRPRSTRRHLWMPLHCTPNHPLATTRPDTGHHPRTGRRSSAKQQQQQGGGGPTDLPPEGSSQHKWSRCSRGCVGMASTSPHECPQPKGAMSTRQAPRTLPPKPDADERRRTRDSEEMDGHERHAETHSGDPRARRRRRTRVTIAIDRRRRPR